ncbi:hypothetical protein HanHA300_Chr17g0639111 [Helianthus annuus]|nr:hypothetical protein HanHA300_Chr17g0639111 [Helianthus annuus]
MSYQSFIVSCIACSFNKSYQSSTMEYNHNLLFACLLWIHSSVDSCGTESGAAR